MIDGTATSIQDVLALACLCFAALSLLINARRIFITAGLPILLIGALATSNLMSSLNARAEIPPTAAIFVLSALALLVNGTPRYWPRVVGGLTVLAAILSLVAMLAWPQASFRAGYQGIVVGADKELIPGFGLLQGIFTSENNLGLFLALGLPFVLTLRRNAARIASFSFTLGIIVLSSSRTALVAAAIGFLGYALARWPGRTRAIFWFHSVLLLTAVLLPLLSWSDGAFTQRGYIWRKTIEQIEERSALVLGLGHDWYARAAGDASTHITSAAVQGHNQFIHVVVVGGIGYLSLVIAMLLLCSRIMYKFDHRTFAVTAAWLSVFLGAAMLEVPFGVVDRSTFWPVVLVPLCAVLSQLSSKEGKSVFQHEFRRWQHSHQN